jgi:hypothetical protein|tara:strand:+ start:1303 stop:2712 length:1410 start_codon:yes stop_codon:yes gene_type:complete
MKKILFAATAALAITSCTSDLSNLNGNVKAPEAVPAGALFANATMGFFDYASVQNVNQNNLRLWAQHWTQCTYVDESNFMLDDRDANGATFTRMYVTVIRDCEEARKALLDVVASPEEIASSTAAIEVMEVLAYMFLVDLFGDVPYTDALSETNVPTYDDDASIYADLLARLDVASSDLSGMSSFGSSDIIYGGDAASWKMAANSLMLRMAIRMIDIDPANAKMYGEKAIASGVFASSSDDMRLFYSSAPPHTHPMWETLVQSGRTDYIASNTLADVMNANMDPRRATYFRNLDSVGNITAAPHGLQSDYYQFSQPGDAMEDPTWSHAAISSVEVEFLLAHAAVAGWAGAGDAATHYDAGVTGSIVEWGGSAADAATYLAQTGVAFDAATAAAQIGTEKWVAMYSNASEAYNTARQYNLTMSVAATAGTVTPARYSYPLDEYSLNTVNVNAAGDKFGGDDTFSKIFWDL